MKNITEEIIRRQVVWDTAPCKSAQTVLERVGASPASEEMLQHEHKISHQRIDGVALLDPYLRLTSKMAAESLFHSILLENSMDVPEDKEAVDSGIEMLYQQYLTATRATVAGLLSEGIVTMRGQ